MIEEQKQHLAKSDEDPPHLAQKTSEEKWRDLALQFDEHRMQAIGLLKFCADHLPSNLAESIKVFLNAPPLRGEKVLADRIALIAQKARTHDENMAPRRNGNIGRSLPCSLNGEMDNIHARLHAARISKKMSMQQMAPLVGVKSWQTIQQWERNPATGQKATAPKRDRLPIVAEVLGVTVDYLYFGAPGPNGDVPTKAESLKLGAY